MKNKNKIHTFPKEAIFKVPDDYFETFEQRLFVALEKDTSVSEKPIRKHQTYLEWIGLAASIILCVGLSFIFNNNNYSKLNSEAVETYLEFQSFSVFNDLESSLNEEDFIELEKAFPLNEKAVDDYLLSNVDIEYYLNE